MRYRYGPKASLRSPCAFLASKPPATRPVWRSTTPTAGCSRTRCTRRWRCTRPTAASCPSSRRATTCGGWCRWLSRCWPTPGSALADLDGIAYTQGPGLAGALLVGASVATALGYALRQAGGRRPSSRRPPAVAAARPTRRPHFRSSRCWCRAGTRQLFEVAGVGRYRLLGDTLDDAAGEAFDKTAKLLGLGYPGGPALARLADGGRAGTSTCRGRCSTAATSISASAGSRPRC